MSMNATDAFDEVLARFGLRKALRICAWASRFTQNSRLKREERITGPLTTEEIEKQHMFWIKRAQKSCHDEDDRIKLNLQDNRQGILECRGQLQGEYPIYLPDSHPYTEKLVQEAHLRTLHGGVGMTMTHVREKHWVPRLRRLVKRVIKGCFGCRRFQAIAVANPPPGKLPQDRTVGDRAFQVLGVDYAGPLYYRAKTSKQAKAYIVLYTCSLTRAIHLEVTTTMETKEFLETLKRLIAPRGRPQKMYSDNGHTFVGAARWVRTVMRDEMVQDFLACNMIKWQFNLSCAPWWGGQFERMVGLVKTSLYKTVGKDCLTWTELTDIILDIEVALNNRPLSYVKDDIQFPILTPNTLMFTPPTILPEMAAHHIQDYDLHKRAKFLKRWTKEYIRGLRERHQHINGKPHALAVGDVVIVKSEVRNRGEWSLGIVSDLYEGRDGIV